MDLIFSRGFNKANKNGYHMSENLIGIKKDAIKVKFGLSQINKKNSLGMWKTRLKEMKPQRFKAKKFNINL